MEEGSFQVLHHLLVLKDGMLSSKQIWQGHFYAAEKVYKLNINMYKLNNCCNNIVDSY